MSSATNLDHDLPFVVRRTVRADSKLVAIILENCAHKLEGVDKALAADYLRDRATDFRQFAFGIRLELIRAKKEAER